MVLAIVNSIYSELPIPELRNIQVESEFVVVNVFCPLMGLVLLFYNPLLFTVDLVQYDEVVVPILYS